MVSSKYRMRVIPLAALLVAAPDAVHGFTSSRFVGPSHPRGLSSKSSSVAVSGSPYSEDDISRQLEKAKAVLAKSKAKLEPKNEEEEDRLAEVDVPFFAVADRSQRISKVIKSRDENGRITTDGDMMAKLSEEEKWERRPLAAVFKNESGRDPASSALLNERDVAMSLFNLRKQLQKEDFKQIFDSRNRFIGEE